MKKLIFAAVATMSLLSFAGEAPAATAKKVDTKPVAAAPAKTVAAAPAKTEKTEVKAEEKKETLTAAPAETASPTTKTEVTKPVEAKKVVTKKK